MTKPVPEPVSCRVDVHGHDALVAGLLRAARADEMPHALLLSGPPGVGKRTVARLVAQALLCGGDHAERPCGSCRGCRLVATDGHPDLHAVEVPLRIEAARDLQSTIALAPTEGERRVVVLAEMERASEAAANSLLKTLEEPPGQAVLILTTAAYGDLLPTIRSRVRHLRMRALAPETAATALRALRDVEPEHALRLARWSAGRPGEALRLLDDDEARAARDAWLDELEHLLAASPAERLGRAGDLGRDRTELHAGLGLWLAWWRDLLHVRHGLEERILLQERLPALREAATQLTPRDGVSAARAVERAQRALDANASTDLAMEVLILGLPRLSRPAAA